MDWLRRWLPWLFCLIVTLSWDASPSAGVAGYKVYNGATAQLPFEFVIDVGNVLTAKIDKAGCFAVTAYDRAGYESSYSNVVCTKPGKIGGFRFEVK